MFIDRAKIYVRGGAGGPGCLSFRREKYVPKGGPDGGNGGRGGNVVFQVNPSVKTLYDVRFHPHIRAANGAPGEPNNRFGKDGKDLVVSVPPGTMVYSEEGELLADLFREGDQWIAAKGGRGGRGNAAFLSNTNRAPYIRELGEPGEELTLILELKLIADVGLIGLPNAGKSTLLSVLSNANPKIASYPFTTIKPNLGAVVSERGFSFVVADLPGLIEGASAGTGLGDRFLKHAERNRLLVHLIDMGGVEGRDPAEDYRVIQNELSQYDTALADKTFLVVANKMDVTEAAGNLERFRQATGIDPFPISAATGMGIRELKNHIIKTLEELPPVEITVPEKVIVHEDKRKFTLSREGGIFFVDGVYIRKIVQMTDFNLEASVRRCTDIMEKIGIFKALAEAGARDGDTVIVAGSFEFFYQAD